MEQLRGCNYHVPVVKRMGIVKAILKSSRAPDELWELFTHLPTPDLNETFGILLEYHIPDRASLLALLQHHAPLFPALAPSHEQLGRESNNMWNDPAAASRDALWDYLIFRWSVRYFEHTLMLMLKAFTSTEELSLILLQANTRSVMMASVVAYHSTILAKLLPRICIILDNPYYCRDSMEYGELLQLTQYVLMSGDISHVEKKKIPFERLFQWGAGMSAHIQSEALRTEAVITLSVVDNVVLESWVRECTDPHLIPALCRILTELPTEVHFLAILALSYSNLLIDIAWDMWHRPFLYESAIHVLLGQSLSGPSYVLNAVLASHLFSRFAQCFPRRNIIESCFYTFTTALQKTNHEPVFRHQIEENLRCALTTNGNRSVFIQLVSMQEEEIQAEWNILFPLLKWPQAPANIILDSVTEQPIYEAWHFESNDTTPVGLETVVHHIASNGLRNPFTNVPFTWDYLLAVNQKEY